MDDALENESGGVETVSNVNLLIKVIVSFDQGKRSENKYFKVSCTYNTITHTSQAQTCMVWQCVSWINTRVEMRTKLKTGF